MKTSHPSSASRVLGKVVFSSVMLVAAAVLGCGEDAGLVGGTCRQPYVECDLACVDITSDPAHCGGCNLVCPPSMACVAGLCGGKVGTPTVPKTVKIDGTQSDDKDGASDGSNYRDAGSGGLDGSTSFDAWLPDGTVGFETGASDVSVPDAVVADATQFEAGDACSPPYVSDDHCGDCSTRCQGTNDTCKPQQSGGYACEPLCTAPLSRCGNACLDLMNDGDNCGACGRVCASNICAEGQCQGAASGDIVYIGHDYLATPTRTAQARLLENAVFLSPRTPVRVLSYQKWASPSAVSRISAILADAQARTGRGVQLTTTTSETAVAAATTANYEVVLVPDQVSAPSGALAPIGAGWAAPLAQYTHVGGVVVVLDSATGSHPQMPMFMSATGLLSVTSHQSVGVTEQFDVIAPNDGVGQGVVTPFAMRAASSRFVSEPNGGRVSWVVRHVTSGEPAVLHKIAP